MPSRHMSRRRARNAGIASVDKPTHEITLGEREHLMKVNVRGVFLCTKHVPAYLASKGAARLMSKNAALTYAKNGYG